MKLHVRLVFHALPDLLHKRKDDTVSLSPPSFVPFFSFILSPQFRMMNPSMSSPFDYSFLPSAPDCASSTGFQSPTSFILSTRQVPYSTPLSCDTRRPGSQGPISFQSPPDLMNTMPSIPVLRDAQAQVPFLAADPRFSLLANGPVVDDQPHGSQRPQFPCSDSEADPKGKQPARPRASNAFILFRSDFLKRKLISRGQEARQHKLSIIAAKCWHKLTREEKTKWFLEAEREKKAHALKYGECQSQSRARARTRRESRTMASPGELEHFGRLADMAYQEIINDTPSQLARESTPSLFTSTTTAFASGPPSSTQDCYQEQKTPFFFPAGEVGHLALPQSYQLPQNASLSDLTSTFQDPDMFPNVSHFYAAFHRPGTVSHTMIFQTGFVSTFPATITRPASAPMFPAASSFSETARQPATLSYEPALRGFTSIYDSDQTSSYFSGPSSLPDGIIPFGFSGLAST